MSGGSVSGGSVIDEAVRMVRGGIASISFATLAGTDAARLVTAFGELRRLAESGLTLAAGRVEATDKSSLAGTGCSSAKDLLSHSAGISSREADGLLDLASRLDDHSATKDLFSDGILSAAEAAEIAKAADRNASAEAGLLDLAQDPDSSFKDLRDAADRVNDPSPDADAKRAAHARNKRNVGSWVDREGVGQLKASGPPDAIAALLARISAEKEARFRAGVRAGQRPNGRHLLFESLYDLVMGGLRPTGPAGPTRGGPGATVDPGSADGPGGSGGSGSAGSPGVGPGAGAGSTGGSMGLTDGTAGADPAPARTPRAAPARVDLMILVHLDALRRGVALPGELCEIPGVGPVPVELARSHLGDAALKFIITDGQDVTTVAHLGRRRGAHLRSALASMFRCCIQCGRTMGLEMDHVQPLAKGGPTSFDNLRPLCRACHRAKTRTDYPEGTTGHRRAQAGAAETARRRAARMGGTGPSGGGPNGGGPKGGGPKGGGAKSGGAKVTPPRRT